MSSTITNRTVKPFIKAEDLYPGFKEEEKCFSLAIIRDMNETRKKKGKSDIDQEGTMTWPREKSANETAYELLLEQVINPKTGEYFPERDASGAAVKNTGLKYYITDITRIRRATGEEFLYKRYSICL